MEFEKTYKVYEEYKSQEFITDSIESVIKTDKDILENSNLFSYLLILDSCQDSFNPKEVVKQLFDIDLTNDMIRLKWLLKIQETFNLELEEGVFFRGCSFEVYLKTLPNRFNEFKKKFEDAYEIDFYEKEYDKIFNSSLDLGLPVRCPQFIIDNLPYADKKKKKYLEEKISELGYQVVLYTDSVYDPYRDEEIKFDGFYIQKKEDEKNQKIKEILETVEWKGTQTELIELIKALIENGTIKGKQKDIISNFSIFFKKEIKNPNKLIQDIKKRSNGSETLFLDSLKSSLTEFID
jgi:hypothetical protein